MAMFMHNLSKSTFYSNHVIINRRYKQCYFYTRQKSVSETENSVKQEQASLKPKWTPPKHPG